MARSSFNGFIHDIPSISVDNFENKTKKAYFLSHCHSDHTVGLYDRNFPRYLEQSGGKIYMTQSSMKIVEFTASNPDICDFIQPLKLGTTTVTIDDGLHIEVTLIPAGHCIGSVMFLFRTNDKTILYTGDFRMNSNDLSKYAQFHKHGEPIHIDVMYVDTTFMDLEHMEFAKRSDSVDEMIHMIDSWLKKDDENRIAIHTSANYTTEFSFLEIYKRLGLKVCVDDDIWQLYSYFPEVCPAVTHKEQDPKIHLCYSIRCVRKCKYNHFDNPNYLSLHLSAYKWKDFETEQGSLRDGIADTIDVCFATHCSRSELVYFVSYLAPTTVIGFPNPYNPRSPKKILSAFVPLPKKRKVLNVEHTEGKKVDSDLLEEMFG